MQMHPPVQRRGEAHAVGDHQKAAAGSLHQIAGEAEHVVCGCFVEISGRLVGQQNQRLCRQRPADRDALLLLADEPTGNLDEDTADEVLALARDLVARSGCGFLMVTHSARLAATLDRQVHLHAGLIA